MICWLARVAACTPPPDDVAQAVTGMNAYHPILGNRSGFREREVGTTDHHFVCNDALRFFPTEAVPSTDPTLSV